MSIAQKTLAIFATAAVAAAVVFSFVSTIKVAEAASLTSSQVSAIVSLLQSFGADAGTIANVQASLNGTTPSTTTTTTTTNTAASCNFTKDLTTGSKGADVTCLQQALIAGGYSIPAGATGYFGAQTVSAVIAWQKAANVTPAAGYFGAKSRAAFNLGGGSTTTSTTTGTTTTTPVATGTGITVMAGTQPANSLAPQGANRVPFTTFTLTAGNDGDVSVNGVTVQRTGLAADADFAGVVLVDNTTGMQLDIAKTFNSNHQATIGGSFIVPRGTTRSFTVAGNMAASGLNTGEAPTLSVVAVNTVSANVAGSLPITGATQTTNNTLTLGRIDANTSSFDPSSPQTKQIGTTGLRFSGLRLTAGSAEDVTVKSIRWNQTGSAGAGDIANLVTVVNGTSYPAVVDSTGKYYTTVFSSGLVVTKGNSIDVYIQGDLVGAASAARTVEFDIYRNTDIYATGNTYGYGVSPAVGTAAPVTTSSHNTQVATNGNPWFVGSIVTIQAGTASIIQNDSTGVPAQNVAINVPNQPLGGFQTTILGEPISVQGIKFTIATTGTATGQITSVSLVDSNGSVVAGPVDASGTNYTTLNFTDTITIPVGTHSYHLIGKIPSTFTNGATVKISSNPSASDWTNITGQTSGNTISLSGASSFTMNTMTVKAATVSIANAGYPASQTVVPGAQGWTFLNVQLDASQSGEDLRLSSLPLILTFATSTLNGAGHTGEYAYSTDLTACQLFNGATALNTGSNTVNSNNINSTSGAVTTFTFDNSFTVTKGTVSTLALKCNISSGASGYATYSWKIAPTGGSATYSVTGVTSGNSLTAGTTLTVSSTNGPTMSASTGSFTATASNSSVAQPAFQPVAAGTTGVTIGYIKFHATSEAINLTKVGLTLDKGVYGAKSTGTGGYSGGGNNVQMAYLYNGSTQVGTVTFTGTQTTATSSLTSVVNLPKDTDVILTIKADLNNIGVSDTAGIGDILKIDPLNAEGTGASSGATRAISASQTGVSGVQIFKSYPTVAFVSNGSTNPNGTNVTLKRFTITANASGPVGIYKLATSLATSSASVTDVKLYAYTDSGYSQGVSSQGSGTGQMGNTACAAGTGCTSNNPTLTFTTLTSPIEIPAGTTYYFALLGTVAPKSDANNWTISPTLLGDAATTTAAAGYNTNVAGTVSTYFVWSDNATTTAGVNDIDWVNGYQVPGLSSTGI